MKKYEERKIPVIADIICDMCGKSCKIDDEGGENYEFATLTAEWGYHSKHDMETIKIELCEDCCYKLKDIIEKYKKENAEKK